MSYVKQRQGDHFPRYDESWVVKKVTYGSTVVLQKRKKGHCALINVTGWEKVQGIPRESQQYVSLTPASLLIGSKREAHKCSFFRYFLQSLNNAIETEREFPQFWKMFWRKEKTAVQQIQEVSGNSRASIPANSRLLTEKSLEAEDEETNRIMPQCLDH